MSRYVIGIDQGTTGTFVGLMNELGNFVAEGYQPHQQIHPQTGWIEHDPMELWGNIVTLVNSVIQQSQVTCTQIAGLGIANQGESVVMWDAETSKSLYNAIVWQDTRTASALMPLMQDERILQSIRTRTGLHLDAYFSASKIQWLLQKVPEVGDCLHKGTLRCGTLDTWFMWMLSGGQVYRSDPSTASRTLLYNIHTLTWDDELLQLFNLPEELMPEVLPTTAHFGEVRHTDLLCQGVPIIASIVDQPAAMVGHACLDAGQIKATYGTGCFINMNTGEQSISSDRGLLTMLAWMRDGKITYGLDGGVLTAGTTINWLCDKLHLVDLPEEIDALCTGVQTNVVTWIPAQIGLGSPYWDRSIRGGWLGISLDTEPAHLIYAVLEGIALRVTQIVQAMEKETGLRVQSLRVDGGLTNNQTLMQLQADLLGYPVEILSDAEATARGVCYLVARQAGLWLDDELIKQHVTVKQVKEPGMSATRRETRLARFEHIIQQIQDIKDS